MNARRRRRFVWRDLERLAFWMFVGAAAVIVGHTIANELGPLPPSYKAISP